MSDTASLEIKVLSTSVDEANRRLDKLEKSGKDATRATDGLMSSFKGLLAPLAAVVSVTAGFNKLVDVTREFDKLNAGLITATGSSEKAAKAFEALREFAAKTPYDLGQAVEGFTQLVNLGLTPSEKALTSYGNTASAMGKDLSQMIGAVADATTGEFERLKEFGIKAKNEGDNISFVFQGVKTTVANNAAEIEKYLMALGENQFAGAMEARMDSLDGAISNLGDSWDQLFLTVSQSGVGDVIEDAVRMATSAIEELTAMVASGELEGYLDGIAGKFDNWGGDVQETIRILTQFYKDNMSQLEDEGSATVSFLIDAFRNFPENVRAFIQIMVVEVAAGLDKAKAYAISFKDGIKAVFNDDTLDGVGARLQASLESINSTRSETISDIMKERDASLDSFEKQIEAARKLREEYDRNQAAKAAQTGDRLAEFKVGGGTPQGQDEGDAKADAKAAKEAERLARKEAAQEAARQREFESVVQGLMSEEEAIQDSYNRRLKIVVDNTSAESAIRRELTEKLQQEREASLAQLEANRQQERDSLYNSLLTEEEMLRQSYERKKQDILESTVVTAEEKQALMSRLEEQFAAEQAEMEMQRIQSQLDMGEQLFSGLAGLAKAYGGEQSKAYRALFAVSKAFSVAQAAMSISTGLAKAQELGFPANLAEMSRVAATGAGILSQINGAQFSGAYDKGGNIPAGKIGLVGEYGPELIEGPAKVTSRAETARMLREGGGESTPVAAPPVNIKNINVLDPSVVGDYLATDDGEQMIMNVVQRNQSNLGK